MRDYGIDKGLIEFRDDEARNQRGWSKGFWSFRKMFRDYLAKLNVPFYDHCCPALTGNSFPVRYNTDDSTLQYHDGTEWVEVLPLLLSAHFIANGAVGFNTNLGWFSSYNIAQQLSGAGAIDLNTSTTLWTTTGANAATLGNGQMPGQVHKVLMVADGGDGTLTATSPSNFSSFTFNDVGDYALFMWTGVAWSPIEWLGAVRNP